MGRRVVHASGFGLRKCANKQHPHEDRISLLPDEILFYILSLLTFKEAARTSVLSKRWIHLWTYVTSLDFDAWAAVDKIPARVGSTEHKRLLQRERSRFVKWVHKVLQSHKALALDEFRVDFDFDKSSQKEIDKWVRYAFKRRVQRLELDLAGTRSSSFNHYTFRCGSFGLSSLRSSEKNILVYFKPLKELSLNKVNVSGEVLEFFLHNCKLLERLVVLRSTGLINLEVSGPSLALQHLEICLCNSLKSLIVCNVNLVSLKISCAASIELKNVPLLVGVSVYDYSRNFKRTITRISCFLPKLEVLSLCVTLEEISQVEENLYGLPQLSELKQLTVVVDVDKSEDDSMLGLTSLIRASPNLEMFVLKLDWIFGKVRRRRKLKNGVSYPYQHLKVVELYGYSGCSSELELVKYLVENSISLEKIIINPQFVWEFGALNKRLKRGWEMEEIEEEEDARRHAKQQLERWLPSHVGLTIV